MAEPARKLTEETVKKGAQSAASKIKIPNSWAAANGLPTSPTLGSKILSGAGKAAGVAGLMLNSAPSVAEPTPPQLKMLGQDLTDPNAVFELPKTEAQKGFTKAEKSKRDAQKETWDEAKKAQTPKAETKATPDMLTLTGGRFNPDYYKVIGDNIKANGSTLLQSTPAESTENQTNAKASVKTQSDPAEQTQEKGDGEDENSKGKGNVPDKFLEDVNYNADETFNTDVNTKAEDEKEQKRLTYNNLYSYYKSGGFGDPASSDAKRDFGFAILETIGNAMQNAGAGITGGAKTPNRFNEILKQGKEQQTSFEKMDKEQQQSIERMRKQIALTGELQKQANELSKNFEKWALDNKIAIGNDKARSEALKRYAAAAGNQMVNNFLNRLGMGAMDMGFALGKGAMLGALGI